MTVLFIRDTADDATFVRNLQGLHNPDRGVVALVAKPGGRRDVWLYADILNALGKTYVAGEIQRARSGAMAFCMAWLVAEDIRDVVLVHGEWLRHQDITSVGLLSDACGIRLWVTVHGGIGDRSFDALAAWTERPVDAALFWPTWRQLYPPMGKSAGTTTGVKRFPAVPTSDFLTFRADARRSLTPAQFAVADSLYRTAFAEADRLGTTEEAIARHLHAALTISTDLNARTVVIRAVQAAAFARGLFIEVDMNGLLRSAGTPAGLQLTDAQWRQIAGAAQPRTSAVATFAALGISPADSHAIPGSDVATDGSSVSVGDRVVKVPEVGRKPLVAQHILRRLVGFSPDDQYLADGSKYELRSIPAVLNAMTQHLGLPLRARYARTDQQQSARWQYRWGVRVTEIA